MTERKWIIIAVVYALIGIAVFGNAAVYFEHKGDAAVAQCERTSNPETRPYCVFKQSTGVDAVFAALLWPFYLSYRIAGSD